MATHHDRRGNNTGVSCHFLPPIPGWEVISVTVLTLPCTVSSSTALEEGYDKVRTPRSRGFVLIRLTSTRPRRLPPVSGKERPTWHRTQGHFTVSSPTSSRCPGMAGHSWSTPLQPPLQGSTKLHLKIPRCPALLLPYKRAGQGSTRGQEQDTSQKPSTSKQRHPTQRSTSQAITPSILFHFLLRLGLDALSRQLVTPTQARKYKLSPSAGRRDFFARTRINPRVFSLHHHPG
jgi:hypothetical protein